MSFFIYDLELRADTTVAAAFTISNWNDLFVCPCVDEDSMARLSGNCYSLLAYEYKGDCRGVLYCCRHQVEVAVAFRNVM